MSDTTTSTMSDPADHDPAEHERLAAEVTSDAPGEPGEPVDQLDPSNT